jgi:hypothetical protein
MLFDVRFLSKIAIGFGHKLFGEDYGNLRHTDMLRTLLWTRRANLDLAQHRVRMRPYYNGLQDYSMKPLSFPLGFAFLLKYVEGNIVVAIIFPSGHFVQASVTDITVDTDFDARSRFAEEQVLISVPQLERCLGPFRLDEYIAWAVGARRIEELASIKSRIVPRDHLPPLT